MKLKDCNLCPYFRETFSSYLCSGNSKDGEHPFVLPNIPDECCLNVPNWILGDMAPPTIMSKFSTLSLELIFNPLW